MNAVGDYDGRDGLLAVSEPLIKGAFRNCSGEFCVSYNFMSIAEGGDDGIFSVRLQKRIGSARNGNRQVITDFSFFTNFIGEGLTAKREVQPPPQHPLDNWSQFQRTMDIPELIKEQLKGANPKAF